MSTELISAIDGEIMDTWAAMSTAAGSMAEQTLIAWNAKRKLGILLAERKQNTPHGQWQALFKTAKGCTNATFQFEFDHSTAQRAIAFAKDNPEEILDLSQLHRREITSALEDAGEIETPAGREDQTATQLTWLDRATSIAQRVMCEVNARIEKTGQQVEQWPADERAAFKSYLQPIIAIYERL